MHPPLYTDESTAKPLDATLYDAEDLLAHIASRSASTHGGEGPTAASLPRDLASLPAAGAPNEGYVIALVLALALSAGLFGSIVLFLLFGS